MKPPPPVDEDDEAIGDADGSFDCEEKIEPPPENEPPPLAVDRENAAFPNDELVEPVVAGCGAAKLKPPPPDDAGEIVAGFDGEDETLRPDPAEVDDDNDIAANDSPTDGAVGDKIVGFDCDAAKLLMAEKLKGFLYFVTRTVRLLSFLSLAKSSLLAFSML